VLRIEGYMKPMQCGNRKLLIDFEDSAQRIRTIAVIQIPSRNMCQIDRFLIAAKPR